ncbi:MAG TPA: hypoxanthine phosphoribosyltransferase [Ruminococcaceae bacterium]|nr:hypoxanthine phosphoribosyltransferase [Oscillospiraceae bacterium]
MIEDIEQVLYTEQQIAERVSVLGKRIHTDYLGKKLLLIGTLKGAFLFMADLARAINLPMEIDFISASSYGNGTTSQGLIHIRKDLDHSPKGYHALIVEDIVDSGRTLSYLTENLRSQHVASVEVCTFLDKPSGRAVSFEPKYAGFTIPGGFVVGYGMDYAEKYRNLPFVGLLKRKIYEK